MPRFTAQGASIQTNWAKVSHNYTDHMEHSHSRLTLAKGPCRLSVCKAMKADVLANASCAAAIPVLTPPVLVVSLLSLIS